MRVMSNTWHDLLTESVTSSGWLSQGEWDGRGMWSAWMGREVCIIIDLTAYNLLISEEIYKVPYYEIFTILLSVTLSMKKNL
jgi:hypothetical protein